MCNKKMLKTISVYASGIIFLYILCIQSILASSFDFQNPDRNNKLALSGAIGFTLDPDTFLMTPGLDFFFSHGLSFGPSIQFGISDRRILLTATGQVKYHFDIDTKDFWERFKPSIQCGMGFAMLHDDIPGGGSDADVGVVIDLGFGFDIFLNDNISLGNHMLFNILTPTIRDRFLFSWHFVTFKYFFQ